MIGTWQLIRLILRRDRVLLPLWILILGMLPSVWAASFESLYPTEAGRQVYVEQTAALPAVASMIGPVFGTSVGALTAQRVGTMHVIIALISLLTVIRHTRTEEDAGRRELLAATVLGRYASLSAAVIVTVAANLVLAVIVGASLISYGSGAWLLGLSLAGSGIAFAAIGALTAQLTEGAVGARGLALGALGVAFLIRAAADGAGSGATWLSPLSWGQRSRPFTGDDWWVLALPVALFAVVAGAAYALSARRDVGAGLLPARLGPATSTRLTSPLALAWRLQRGPLFGWVIGLAVGGLVLGGVADAAKGAFDSSPQAKEIFGRLGGASGAADIYLATVFAIMAIAVSAYGIQAALRLRAEESAQRAEPVLATSVGRVPWVLSHVLFAVAGPALALSAFGLGAGYSYGLATGDVGAQLPRVLGAALVQVPAVLVLTGIAVALFGLLPRLTVVAWVALGVFLLLGQIGAVLQLSQSVLDLSPFTHTPRLPGGSFSLTPVLWLSALAAALLAAGTYGSRRRDIG